MSTADLPVEPFASPAAWSGWLAKHHADGRGVWMKLAKKATGIPSVTYDEAVDVALCWGWIDGQKRPIDATWWLQRFTPRGPRSSWSKVNRERVARLVSTGLMQAAGVAEVDRAKADGRWEAAYDGQRTATVPDDLRAALDSNPAASAFFETLKSGSRYAILYRIGAAKRPETRQRHIDTFIAMLAEAKAPHLM